MLKRLGPSMGALAATLLLGVLIVRWVPSAWLWRATMAALAWVAAGILLALLTELPTFGAALGRPLPRWVMPLVLQRSLGLSGAARGGTAATEGLTGTWRVVEGDSFWSIAQQAWRRAYGSDPAPHDLAAYWLAVVDANRGRLLHSDDTDELVPGQVVVLPPPGDEDGTQAAHH